MNALHVRGRALPGERATPAEKLALVLEILLVYASARRRMPRSDIRAAVLASRRRAPGGDGRFQPGAHEAWRLAAHLGRAVDRTLRVLPTDSRCLIQSLVLCELLAVRGIEGKLIIGARSQPEFAAHAWVEHAGRPVLPPRGFHHARLLEI